MMCRSGRPGSSTGRPGTASRPPAMRAGVGGEKKMISSPHVIS